MSSQESQTRKGTGHVPGEEKLEVSKATAQGLKDKSQELETTSSSS